MSMVPTFDPGHKLAQELYRRAHSELRIINKSYASIGRLRVEHDLTFLTVTVAVPPTRGLKILLYAAFTGGEIDVMGSIADLEWAVGVLRRRQVLDDLANT